MGASWSVTKREEVVNFISCAFFPSDKQANTWKGQNQTTCTQGRVFYYLVTINLGDILYIWFINLWLLQIRTKLRLITSLRLSLLSQPSCVVSGKIIAKIQALEDIIGKDMISNHRIPPMKKPRMKIVHNIANLTAKSYRARGLDAKQKREEKGDNWMM